MKKDKKVTFLYNGDTMTFLCKNEENIFERFSKQKNKDRTNLCFLYNGNVINEDFDLGEIKYDEIKIYFYKVSKCS